MSSTESPDGNTPDLAPGLAPCGCPADAAGQGHHNHVCLIRQTMHVHSEPIPGEPGRAYSLQVLASGNSVWGDDRVLPDHAVLQIKAPVPPGVEVGLWQRQGPALARLSESAFIRCVGNSCSTGGCGLCDACTSYSNQVQNCVVDAAEARRAIAAALAALHDATKSWSKLSAHDTGDSSDLSSRDASDGARGLDDASYSLRMVDAVLARHIEHLDHLSQLTADPD